MLWQVTAPHFCAGLLTCNDEVVAAAPILKWTIGKTRTELRKDFAKRGWKVAHVR